MILFYSSFSTIYINLVISYYSYLIKVGLGEVRMLDVALLGRMAENIRARS